jgi:murein DD-endopeptidase MepM/ murein hydrolase activator NlpD
MTRTHLRPVTLTLALVVFLATAATAGAQTTPDPAPTTAPTTPETTASPSTTASPCLLLCPTTSSPPTSSTPSTKKGTVDTQAPSTTSPSPGGDGEPPPGTPRIIPPDAQRQIDSVRRTGPNNTEKWLAAIQPLVTELGMTPAEAAIAAGVHFPVAGPTSWVDDWLYPRYVPSFHLHKGLDMFAASGTPVRAPFDGLLKLSDGAVGGLAAYVTQSDGTYVYMAHLSGFAPDKKTGQQVRQGEVVGFVGDTGNARGGAPHVHLQLHPRGGEPAPPKPTVDAWLAEAIANAPAVIAQIRAARTPAPAAVSASVTPVAEDGTLGAEATIAADPAAALWAAASNPAIGTIDLASSLVASAADGIAWPTPPAPPAG